MTERVGERQSALEALAAENPQVRASMLDASAKEYARRHTDLLEGKGGWGAFRAYEDAAAALQMSALFYVTGSATGVGG